MENGDDIDTHVIVGIDDYVGKAGHDNLPRPLNLAATTGPGERPQPLNGTKHAIDYGPCC